MEGEAAVAEAEDVESGKWKVEEEVALDVDVDVDADVETEVEVEVEVQVEVQVEVAADPVRCLLLLLLLLLLQRLLLLLLLLLLLPLFPFHQVKWLMLFPCRSPNPRNLRRPRRDSTGWSDDFGTGSLEHKVCRKECAFGHPKVTFEDINMAPFPWFSVVGGGRREGWREEGTGLCESGPLFFGVASLLGVRQTTKSFFQFKKRVDNTKRLPTIHTVCGTWSNHARGRCLTFLEQ